MTREEWLQSRGFQWVAASWERGGITVDRLVGGQWRACSDGVRGYGPTPQGALRELRTYCVGAAAQHKAQAARLDTVADAVSKVLNVAVKQWRRAAVEVRQ